MRRSLLRDVRGNSKRGKDLNVCELYSRTRGRDTSETRRSFPKGEGANSVAKGARGEKCDYLGVARCQTPRYSSFCARQPLPHTPCLLSGRLPNVNFARQPAARCATGKMQMMERKKITDETNAFGEASAYIYGREEGECRGN